MSQNVDLEKTSLKGINKKLCSLMPNDFTLNMLKCMDLKNTYRIFAYIRRVLYKVLHTPHPGCDLYSRASNLINFLHERAVTCVILTILG